MLPENQQRFNAGWNDLAEGVLPWTDSDKWATPLDWVNEMEQIAEEQIPKLPKGFKHNRFYFNGVIAAARHYRQHGYITKMPKVNTTI